MKDFLNQPFSKTAQQWLEATYLVAMKSLQIGNDYATNKRMGYIPRWVHGAMHAGRVAVYVDILNQLFNEHFQAYALQSRQSLLKYLDLSEPQLLTLIQLIALGHDVARQNEGCDMWEKKSAEMTAAFLKQQGVPPQQADILSKLIEYKDKPEALTCYCQSLKLAPEVIDGLQYARQLIALSDCFDIIRCCGRFDYQFISNLLKTVPGYSPERHDGVFFDFAVHVAELLTSMHDVFFKTSLQAPAQPNQASRLIKGDFSLAEKTKFEHADNVIDQIKATMCQHDYFRRYIPETEAQQVMVPYKHALIHGTQSSMLPLLVKTNGEMMGAMRLLEQFGLAPITGELSKGGLGTLSTECRPCFALMHNPISRDGCAPYNLRSIVADYAMTRRFQPSDLLEQAKSDLDREIGDTQSFFTNHKLIAIYLARYREFGGDVSQYRKIDDYLSKQIQIYYFYLLLAKYTNIASPRISIPAIKNTVLNKLYPILTRILTAIKRLVAYLYHCVRPAASVPTDQPAQMLQQGEENHKDEQAHPFNFKNLQQCMETNFLDFESVYNHYQPETYQTMLDTCHFTHGPCYPYDYESISKGVYGQNVYLSATLQEKQVIEGEYKGDRPDLFLAGHGQTSPDFLFYYLAEHSDRGCNYLGQQFTSGTETLLLNQIDRLKRTRALFFQTLLHPLSADQVIDVHQDFIAHPFPILLICLDAKGFNGITLQGEFRPQGRLVLGQQIQAIATDTEDNKRKLDVFLRDAGFTTVQVLLFQELQPIVSQRDVALKTVKVSELGMFGERGRTPPIPAIGVHNASMFYSSNQR